MSFIRHRRATSPNKFECRNVYSTNRIDVFNNILTAIVSNKLYPQYQAEGKLPKESVKEINQKIKDLFTSKLGFTIVSSADTVVISAFLGLEALAIYQNYYYIINAVMGFVAIIYSSITAGVGNSMIVYDTEKNYHDYRIFTFLACWITAFCVSCFSGLFQPFMKLWMGKDLLLPYPLVILLCVYFWVYVCCETKKELYHLQGSKYVQSSLGNIFKDVQKKLKNDIFVLFSGTPCQVDALKSYLRKDYPNLLTVDIICHGVPSEQFFNDYIHYTQKKIGGEISEFKFRDKSSGWGYNLTASLVWLVSF